ncbi:MAG: hypothetical protein K2I10_05540 [Lachnospiraceae bacterium]|nr:hypothetical protein [Lachnospiraceae bacterium]
MDNRREQSGKNWLGKIDDFIRTALIVVGLLLLFCGGVFQIAAYGIPLGNRERDMHQVLNGIGMLGILLAIILLGKLFYMFLEYLDKKHGNFNKEINPKKWPIPMLRTVKRTLINMSMKAGLMAWDVVTVCIVISLVITLAVSFGDGDDSIDSINMLFAGAKLLLICLIIRLFIVLFYYLRNYTSKMLHYSEKYVGIRDSDRLLKDLEKSLKEELLYYSPQWMITKNFFMAWCDSDACFHPIAIPVNEMCHLKYEIRTRRVKWTTVDSAVIVCRLRNGQIVDLYVGNRFKVNIIWRVLQYFKIPFENTLTPDAYYETPFEITVTPPESGEF